MSKWGYALKDINRMIFVALYTFLYFFISYGCTLFPGLSAWGLIKKF